jgi:hypothetical protein
MSITSLLNIPGILAAHVAGFSSALLIKIARG